MCSVLVALLWSASERDARGPAGGYLVETELRIDLSKSDPSRILRDEIGSHRLW